MPLVEAQTGGDSQMVDYLQRRRAVDLLTSFIQQKYLNEDISYFFQKHIIIGEDIILKNDDLIEDFKIDILENIPTVASKNNNAKGFIIN